MEIAKGSLHFFRVSTLGEVLILTGHLLLALNLALLLKRYYQVHFHPLLKDVTAELKTAEVKP
jgi:hypothetical protein